MVRRLAIIAVIALGATASAPAQPTAERCLGKPATIIGTPGDDNIHGTAQHDVIAGLGGNDTIDQLLGGDTVCGGEGNDSIATGRGESEAATFPLPVVSGDAGDDVLTADESGFGPDIVVSFEEAPGPVLVNLATGLATGWGNDRFVNSMHMVKGSAYADTITGNDSFNYLSGGAGDDRLFGLDTTDILDGGAGDDTLDGGKQRPFDPLDSGADTASYAQAPRGVVVNLASGVATGWGDDRLINIESAEGSRYADRLRGGPILLGLAGNDVLLAGGGINWLGGGGGDDLLVGGNGEDTMRGDSGFESRFGMSVVGRPGNDHLRGGRGRDDLAGEGGRDRLEGGPGGDWLGERDPGNDTIDGGAGDDWVRYEFAPGPVFANLESGRVSGYGQDRLSGIENLIGSWFADRLTGSPARNEIYARRGADFVSGASGDDNLNGEDGNDRVVGGPGRDLLDGGAGRDSLDGGPGRDRCVAGERRRGCP